MPSLRQSSLTGTSRRNPSSTTRTFSSGVNFRLVALLTWRTNWRVSSVSASANTSAVERFLGTALLLPLGGNLPPAGEREQTLQLSINNCLLRFRKLLTGNRGGRGRGKSFPLLWGGVPRATPASKKTFCLPTGGGHHIFLSGALWAPRVSAGGGKGGGRPPAAPKRGAGSERGGGGEERRRGGFLGGFSPGGGARVQREGVRRC